MRALIFLATTLVMALASPARVAGAETYGTGVSVSEATPIGRVLERPRDFEGQTLKVEGVVTAVCTAMGCWMALAPDGAPQAQPATLLIKVDDGVIVFPVSAKGRRASAQGVLQRIGGDAHDREAADEHAKTEGRSAEAGAWQLKATGAVVY
ncbi:MAG: hypothetical protein GEU82_04190 [Luteitalea sp.]|nr:hypothetical protein [Luteitalea sp.]